MKKEQIRNDARRVICNALRIDRQNIKESEDGKRTYIEGYACHFGAPNLNMEMVNEEAFANFFKQMEEAGQMPILNYEHMTGSVIGGWDEITSDEKGLYAKGHLVNDCALVRDTVLPLLRDGVLDALSTEGWARSCEYIVDENGDIKYYECKDFMLIGISLVSFPADMAARVTIENRLNLSRKNRGLRNYRNGGKERQEEHKNNPKRVYIPKYL